MMHRPMAVVHGVAHALFAERLDTHGAVILFEFAQEGPLRDYLPQITSARMVAADLDRPCRPRGCRAKEEAPQEVAYHAATPPRTPARRPWAG